ncbi:MAG TPA: hypothetical protein VK939_03680 [Longimicrobiales bacterium]|nr:hypothetical protein [Longimicrobiales bacterium]
MPRKTGFLLVAMTLAACSKDTAGPENGGLTGNWVLEAWVWTHAQNPALTVDWVQTRSLTGTLDIEGDGSFTSTPMLPLGVGSDYGELTIDGDSIYWNGRNDEEWVRFTLGGNRLTLYWPEWEIVDMDQDGEPEDAWLRVRFRRQ